MCAKIGSKYIVGHNRRGSKNSAASIAKFRTAMAARPKGTKKGRPSPLRGCKQSPEHIKKRADSHRGKSRPPLSESHKQAVSKALQKYYSEHSVPESRREKIRRAHIGKHVAQETRDKLREINKGKPRSLESIAKGAQTIRIQYANGTRKPSGHRGISGSWRGIKFRSSCELNFLLTYENVPHVVRADLSEFVIPYVDSNGSSCSYFPDYFDKERKIIFEVKPSGFMKYCHFGSRFLMKKEAADSFCSENGMQFVLVEIDSLNRNRIVFPMRGKDEIELTPFWESKYQKWLQ